jgi:phage terminase large subunit-like protein
MSGVHTFARQRDDSDETRTMSRGDHSVIAVPEFAVNLDTGVLQIDDEFAWRRKNKFEQYFLAEGPFRRSLYVQHMKFFAATKGYREVMFMAGNRTGKTTAGAYAVTQWLTGRYADWWPGRRFDGPVDVWAASDSSQTTRDILQAELLGPAGSRGEGMIPADAIASLSPRTGVPDAVEMVWVKHVDGGKRYSTLQYKSYDQGREKWQGTGKDVVWLDEAAPQDIYSEALVRTLTRNGLVMITFTPVEGLTDLVASFLEGDNKAVRIE